MAWGKSDGVFDIYCCNFHKNLQSVVFWLPVADTEHKYADDRTEYTGLGRDGVQCRVGVDTSCYSPTHCISFQ